MDISTVILQVYGIYGALFILFAFLGVALLVRKRTRVSITLSLVFFIPAIGILINILYRAIDRYEFNLIANKLTIIFACLGLINILSFIMIIRESNKAYTVQTQIITFLIYLGLLLGLFLIPNGVEFEYKGVAGLTGYNTRRLEPLDLGVPVYSTIFFLYGMIVSQTVMGFIVFQGIKLYQEMGKNSLYRQKYIRTLIGLILMDIYIIGSFIFNWWNNPTGRNIHLIMSLCIIPATIFLYLGLKQESSNPIE